MNIRFYCSLTIIFFIGITNINAEFTENINIESYSEYEFVGSTKDKAIKFAVIVTKKNTIDAEFEFNNKIINISKGYGTKKNVFHLKGYSKYDGNMIKISKDEQELLKPFLTSSEDFASYGKIETFFYNSLSLLINWPNNMPLIVYMDKNKAVGMINDSTPVSKNRKQLEIEMQDKKILPENKYNSKELFSFGIYSICWYYYTGVSYYAGYYEDGSWIPINRPVGDVNCFGKCGMGCGSSQYSQYTHDCFIHDGCVDNSGYTWPTCNELFLECIDDYYFAPNCD